MLTFKNRLASTTMLSLLVGVGVAVGACSTDQQAANPCAAANPCNPCNPCAAQ